MIHAGHIEVAVAKLLNYRVHAIVPNVSWGLGLRHECDMLALDEQNRFTEIEIKVTASDLKADFKKPHQHKSKLITRLIYAMPEKLCLKYSELIPKECGIIRVSEIPDFLNRPGFKPVYRAAWHRQCRHRKTIEKIPEATIRKFLELGCMRIWSLKEHNNRKP
jgi:hypothetical protein